MTTPPGEVSTIRGRWQRPALTWTTRVALAVAAASIVAPAPVGSALAVAAVAAVVAVPLLRVAWLVFRWHQEDDARFVAAGTTLLVVIGVGALLSALGVGR